MASDMNRIMLVARLVKDPELRHTQNGTAVASFSVANNKSFTQGNEKKEQTSYFPCVAWGKLGEIIAQYCRKGHRIGIEGRLGQRSWNDKEGVKRSIVEITIENCQFLQPKTEANGNVKSDIPADEDLSSPGNGTASEKNLPFDDNDMAF